MTLSSGISKTALIPPPNPVKRAPGYRPTRLKVQKSWTRLWWLVWDPDESIGTADSYTKVRAFDRTRAIEKALKRWLDAPKNAPEEIDIAQYLSEGMRLGPTP